MHAETEKAFLANLEPNLGIVHRVCRTYFPYDAAECEDVYQDILYQLWRAYPQFKGEAKFSTWMYRVALSTAITHVRRETRAPRKEGLTETAANGTDVHERMRRREEHELLHEAIASLTDIDKAIILLHLEEQNYDEIAAITGLTKTNVSVRLVRIKRALKEVIEAKR